MTKQALEMALEALELSNVNNWWGHSKIDKAITAIKEALAQPEQEPVAIWYMRDNHTFKKLSADVSTALIEIEKEFNEGYTYGMLCSKRKGFPNVHASGEKKRLEFFAECKKTLEEWMPNTTPPASPKDEAPQRKPLTEQQIRGIARDVEKKQPAYYSQALARAIEAAHGIFVNPQTME